MLKEYFVDLSRIGKLKLKTSREKERNILFNLMRTCVWRKRHTPSQKVVKSNCGDIYT